MNTHDIDIELPPEFRSGNSVPVERATIKRERMEEILRYAIESDRKRRGEPVAWIQRSYLNLIRESNVALHNVVVRGSILDGDGDVVPLFTSPQPAGSTFTTPDCPRCGCVQDGQCLCNPSRPSTEPVKVPSDAGWDLAEKVRRDLDRQSCPDVYMRIAMESIVKHYGQPAQPAASAAPQPLTYGEYITQAGGRVADNGRIEFDSVDAVINMIRRIKGDMQCQA